MSDTHYLARSTHDLGLAAWFGGSLMGAVGLNGAAAKAQDPTERLRLSHVGWSRWAPVQAVGIGAYLFGAVRITQTDAYRVEHQAGVGASSLAKTVLTAGAIAASAWSGALNLALLKDRDAPTAGATEASPVTSPATAAKLKQLKALQWAIPALTGGILVSTSVQGEQQRPRAVVKGLLKR